MKRQGQTWSFEAYAAVSIFMLVIIFFVGMIVTSREETQTDIDNELQAAVSSLISLNFFADGVLTSDEMLALTSMNCQELKDLFSTDKEVCIYFKDQDNRLIDIDVDPVDVHYGFGCPGLNISDTSCDFNN